MGKRGETKFDAEREREMRKVILSASFTYTSCFLFSEVIICDESVIPKKMNMCAQPSCNSKMDMFKASMAAAKEKNKIMKSNPQIIKTNNNIPLQSPVSIPELEEPENGMNSKLNNIVPFQKVREDNDNTNVDGDDNQRNMKTLSGCPCDKDELGRSSWDLIHTLAANYPDEPSAEMMIKAVSFFESLALLYPCPYCAEDFQKYIKQYPPDVSSRKELVLWCCNMHNDVNRKTGKDEFECNLKNLDVRWRTGVASCWMSEEKEEKEKKKKREEKDG